LIEDLENQHKVTKAFLSTLYLKLGLINNSNNSPKFITKIFENESDGIAYAHIDENMKEEQKRPSIPLPQLHFSNVKRKKVIYSNSCPKDHFVIQMLLDWQDAENSSDEDEFKFFTAAVISKQCRCSYICQCSEEKLSVAFKLAALDD